MNEDAGGRAAARLVAVAGRVLFGLIVGRGIDHGGCLGCNTGHAGHRQTPSTAPKGMVLDVRFQYRQRLSKCQDTAQNAYAILSRHSRYEAGVLDGSCTDRGWFLFMGPVKLRKLQLHS